MYIPLRQYFLWHIYVQDNPPHACPKTPLNKIYHLGSNSMSTPNNVQYLFFPKATLLVEEASRSVLVVNAPPFPAPATKSNNAAIQDFIS